MESKNGTVRCPGRAWERDGKVVMLVLQAMAVAALVHGFGKVGRAAV